MTLHTAPTQPAPNPFGQRWLSSLHSSRGKRLVSAPQPSISTSAARTEALSGFRSIQATNRVVSAPSTSAATCKRKLSQVSRPKSQRNRFGPDELTPVNAIYFVPAAFDNLVKFTSNTGANLIKVECPAPNRAVKERLVLAGYGRVSNPDDEDILELDPTLSPEGTAAFLAALFPDPYQSYCTQKNHPPESAAPVDWCIQLVKRGRVLRNNRGEVELTTRMLLSNAHMDGGRVLSKEIYLGIDAGLPFLDKLVHAGGKGKAKATQQTTVSSSESDTDTNGRDTRSPSPKRLKRVLRSRVASPPSTTLPGVDATTVADLPTNISEVQAAASPAPTAIEVSSDSDLEETSFVLSQTLNISKSDTPSTVSNAQPEAGPGPSTVANRTSQPNALVLGGWGDFIDPFSEDYSI
ncbi:hypothetical protein FRC08_013999 [Ceratobasidium sp. 394]|nr:hypothetical protein FRC08_013999 [Ceratobasidium sp. 394]